MQRHSVSSTLREVRSIAAFPVDLKAAIASFGCPIDQMKEVRKLAYDVLEQQKTWSVDAISYDSLATAIPGHAGASSHGEPSSTNHSTFGSLPSPETCSIEKFDGDEPMSSAPNPLTSSSTTTQTSKVPSQEFTTNIVSGTLGCTLKDDSPSPECGRQQTEKPHVWTPAPSRRRPEVNHKPHKAHANIDSAEIITTLVIQNIPVNCTTSMLMKELKSQGFEGVYDFLYQPVHNQTRELHPAAYVNFVTPQIATAFFIKFHGKFLKCSCAADGPVMVLAASEQGLVANAARYCTRDSEGRRRHRAWPVFPQVDDSRMIEVETYAKRLLLDAQAEPADDAFTSMYKFQ